MFKHRTATRERIAPHDRVQRVVHRTRGRRTHAASDFRRSRPDSSSAWRIRPISGSPTFVSLPMPFVMMAMMQHFAAKKAV
jgi:hypothetical protein